jgi:endonuclease/exonuclease/phosphatase family metal-dependent hydrolase
MTALRVATYNIHKGVQGLGPSQRLEIHNLGHAVEQFDADVVCLQEVRKINRRHAKRFANWPTVGQADFLAPLGYEAVYQSNAVTRHGEHGNALLSRWPVVRHRHEDMSDHRFEQRGLLHAELKVSRRTVHVIVVHLGLLRASRRRQTEQLADYIQREVGARAPLVVAGDFNEPPGQVAQWLAPAGLLPALVAHPERSAPARTPTFPSRLPILQLDHVFARGLHCTGVHVPRGRIWWRMSDHLPLIADLEMA